MSDAPRLSEIENYDREIFSSLADKYDQVKFERMHSTFYCIFLKNNEEIMFPWIKDEENSQSTDIRFII